MKDKLLRILKIFGYTLIIYLVVMFSVIGFLLVLALKNLLSHY